MAIIYKVKQASKANKEGKKLYHPSTVHIGLVTTAQMAKEVAEYSSLTAGDVKNTIDNLITVMHKHLASSEVVELDGIGTFRIRLKSQGKGVENPDGGDCSEEWSIRASSSCGEASLFRLSPTRNRTRTVKRIAIRTTESDLGFRTGGLLTWG